MHDVCMRVLKWLGLVRKHSPVVAKEPVPSEPIQQLEPEETPSMSREQKIDVALEKILPKKGFPLHQYGNTDLHGYIDGTLLRITDTSRGKRVLMRDTVASTLLYQRGGGGQRGYRYINTTTAMAYLLAGRHASWTRTKRIDPALPPTPQNIQLTSDPAVTLRDYLMLHRTELKLTPEEIEYLRAHENVPMPSPKKPTTRKVVKKRAVKPKISNEIAWHYHPTHAIRVNVLGKIEAISDAETKMYVTPNVFTMTRDGVRSDDMELGTALKVDLLTRGDIAAFGTKRVYHKRCSLKLAIINSFLDMTELPAWADPSHSRHKVRCVNDGHRKITSDINWFQALQVKLDDEWVPFTTILETTYAHLFTPEEIEILKSYHDTDGSKHMIA